MKIYRLDFSLHFGSCCLLRVCRSLHLITSQLRMKQSLDCPNHIRRTKRSIKKRIIVRRSVRSMFGEQTFAQLRTGFRQRRRSEYSHDATLRASLSTDLLHTLPESLTPLKGHYLSPRSCSPTLSATSERFGYQ